MDIKEFAKNSSTDMNTHYRHPWEVCRLLFIREMLGRFQNKKSFRVLDVGCGDLYVASSLYADKSVVEYCAVDSAFNLEIIEELKQKFAVPHNCRLVTDINTVNNESSDVALLLDVVEHVENDRGFLRSIKEKLVNGAFVIITVPAYNLLFSNHDRLLGHFRRYSPKSIQNLAEEELGPVLKAGSFFFSLLGVRFFQVLLEKLLPEYFSPNKQHGVSKWNGGKVLTTCLTGILWLDYKLCKTLRLPGLSVYIVCQIQK